MYIWSNIYVSAYILKQTVKQWLFFINNDYIINI